MSLRKNWAGNVKATRNPFLPCFLGAYPNCKCWGCSRGTKQTVCMAFRSWNSKATEKDNRQT